MHVYRMTLDQLQVAHAKVCKLAVEIGRDDPEVGWLLLDACKLALDEIMVHVCKGNRKLAAKMTRNLDARLLGGDN